MTASPFTKEEQIVGILTGNTQKMVQRFARYELGVDANSFFNWLTTVDASRFFTVTEQELQEYVAAHGFPVGRVDEGGGLPEDKFVVDEVQPGYFDTYGVERGQKYEVQTFASLSEARARLIRRLIIVMRVGLNLNAQTGTTRNKGNSNA